MRRSLGYTLIELLLSVAVVGILAAVVIPALGLARIRAQTAECAANLRQIGAASLLWSADNEGKVVPVFYPGDHRDPLSQRHWPSLLAPYMGYTLPLADMASSKAFVCPLRPERFGYGYNYTYLSWVQLPGVEQWVQYGEVPMPARTVMFADNGEHGAADSLGWRPFIRRPGSVKDYVVDFRHGRGDTANVLWVDGHVSEERRDSEFFRDDKLWKIQ